MQEEITSAEEEVSSTEYVTFGSETDTADLVEGVIPPQKKKRHVNQQKLQDNLWGWAFCLPLIIGTVWFVYAALVMAIMLSFTNYRIADGSLFEFLGHLNKRNTLYIGGGKPYYDPMHWYKQIFTAKTTGTYPMHEAGRYLFNTVFYMIGIPIGMILAMFFAVCMSRDIKGGNVFRILYYVPCVASSISIIYTFRLMFSTQGVINSILGTKGFAWLGKPGAPDMTWYTLTKKTTGTIGKKFMDDPFWCQGFFQKLVIVIMSVWKGLGGTIILYVAGLSGVNAATKEAAQIDGANGWKIFWKIMMPDLYPVIFYNIVTAVIGGLQIYAEPVLFFGEAANGSYTSGYVSLVWGYGLSSAENSLSGGKPYVGAGAAYGLILGILILILTLFQFWLDGRKKD